MVAGDEQGRHVELARPLDGTNRAMQVAGQHQHVGIDSRRRHRLHRQVQVRQQCNLHVPGFER